MATEPATPHAEADRESVAQMLQDVRRRAPHGHRLHLAAALLYLFSLPFATAPNAIAFLLLTIVALARLHWTWRCLTPLARMPVIWAMIAFVTWYALAIAWSDDPRQGWDEVQAFRVLLVPWLLWPVIESVVPLVVAALLGVFASNVVQLLQALDIVQPGYGGRLDALLHAIQLGSWCAAAMCWHLSASLLTRRWWRWGSIIGLVAATVGLVATGSRGPWIAAAIAMPLCLGTIAWRRPETRRFALMLVGIGVLGAIAAWPVVGSMVTSRIEAAVEELEDPGEPDYLSSTGLRLGLWDWAIDIWQDAPVAGSGAGSFRVELEEEPEFVEAVAEVADDPDDVRWLTRDHAHSTYLHSLATTGLVGFGTLLAVLGLAGWRAIRDRADHPYSMAHVFVLLTWLIGAQFDCYHLNGHQLGLLAIIIAFSLMGRGSRPASPQ